MSGKTGKKFTEEELAFALRHFEELATDAMISFFPRLETAVAVKEQRPLTGEAIYVAIFLKDARTRYSAEVISAGTGKTQEDILDDFEYLVGEVPVKVQVIKRNYQFYRYPNQIIYNYGNYLLPNPWDIYWKSRFLVR